MGKGQRLKARTARGAASTSTTGHGRRGSDERSAEDALLAPARHLLDTDDPVDAETFASALAALWRPDALAGSGLSPQGVPGFVDSLAACGRPEALAILRGLSAVLPGLDAARAHRAADAMTALGVRDRQWARSVGQATVTQCWLMSHVLGDGDNVMLVCRYPDGHEHTVVTYIDHNVGSLVKDAFLGPPDTVGKFRELTADEPDTTIEPISPAEAAGRIRAALDRSDVGPPFESETWPAVRPLLEARLATLPDDGSSSPRPELSAAERGRLVESFLAAPEGANWHDDPHGPEIAHHLVSFRCDYGDGQPLRWSPVVVEILLIDWFPRKVAGSPDLYAAVPDVLRDWIRYAGRCSGLRASLVDETLRAVEEFAAEFRELAADPRAWGPAKTVVQGMLAAGVDLGDEDAVDRYVDDLNARAGPHLLEDEPYPLAEAEPFDWRGIPDDLRSRVGEILAHCDRVCDAALDGQYAAMARRLVAKLARKRPSPLRRGDPRIWAGGVLYALGQVNFLFDAYSSPHLPAKELAAVAGVSIATISAKAGVVREAVRLRDFDEEFTRPEISAAVRW